PRLRSQQQKHVGGCQPTENEHRLHKHRSTIALLQTRILEVPIDPVAQLSIKAVALAKLQFAWRGHRGRKTCLGRIFLEFYGHVLDLADKRTGKRHSSYTA